MNLSNTLLFTFISLNKMGYEINLLKNTLCSPLDGLDRYDGFSVVWRISRQIMD